MDFVNLLLLPDVLLNLLHCGLNLDLMLILSLVQRRQLLLPTNLGLLHDHRVLHLQPGALLLVLVLLLLDILPVLVEQLLQLLLLVVALVLDLVLELLVLLDLVIDLRLVRELHLVD